MPKILKAARPFKMSLSLSVLKHLGLNLYSNVPAVLSEVVANSWDADAQNVWITLDADRDTIVIEDDGHGMSMAEINSKYLCVGFDKLENDGRVTPRFKRPAMGRKGIGKLSLFSIADVIELYTAKSGKRHGLRMSAPDILKQIKMHSDRPYFPTPIKVSGFDRTAGTRIVISRPKKRLSQAVDALRKRVARRFSVIGDSHDFSVWLNGAQISVSDRDYFHKLQYVWWYGDADTRYAEHCTKVKPGGSFRRLSEIDVDGSTVKISGWIGTVESSGDLKDGEENLNRITVLVRGKVALEDLLTSFNEGGVYTKYLIGEIEADFLDDDRKADIATSNRQQIIEDDPRFVGLRAFVSQELKNIENRWSDLRNEEGTSKALQIPAIKNWFDSLSAGLRPKAERLFGKINQIAHSSDERRELLKHAVLAFEALSLREELDRLETITPDNLSEFTELFSNLDDLEATLYYQIVRERLAVIEKLQDDVTENAKEKVLQTHLFSHLWLLDPSWERATDGTEHMERSVKRMFKDLDVELSEDERRSRLDIKYKTAASKHIIVELKRSDRVLATEDVLKQCRKYKKALRKVLDVAGHQHEPIEVVCVVGRQLSDWETPSDREQSRLSLAAQDIRVVLYSELIEHAQQSYGAYLESKKRLGRIRDVIVRLDDAEPAVQTKDRTRSPTPARGHKPSTRMKKKRSKLMRKT